MTRSASGPLLNTSRTSGPRENSFHGFRHPDPLRVDGRELTLISDPLVDRVTKGDPILGWGGDSRLAVYLDPVGRNWLLFRLEHDGRYRVVAQRAADTVSVVDLIPQLILRLIAHDTRRGYDVAADVNAVNAAVDAEHERQRAERTEDFA